jgi:hypothetical protein
MRIECDAYSAVSGVYSALVCAGCGGEAVQRRKDVSLIPLVFDSLIALTGGVSRRGIRKGGRLCPEKKKDGRGGGGVRRRRRRRGVGWGVVGGGGLSLPSTSMLYPSPFTNSCYQIMAGYRKLISVAKLTGNLAAAKRFAIKLATLQGE